MNIIKLMKKYIFETWTILAILSLLLLPQLNIGVSKNTMIKDEGKNQQIQANWVTTSSINDDLGAFISYPEDLSHHRFSIYQKGAGPLSFGYHFRSGGSMPVLDQEILKVETHGEGSILLSLNKQKVSKIEIFKGLDNLEVITINSEKPFTMILPESYTEVKIYDVNGNLIPFESITVNHI